MVVEFSEGTKDEKWKIVESKVEKVLKYLETFNLPTGNVSFESIVQECDKAAASCLRNSVAQKIWEDLGVRLERRHA